MSDPIWRGRRQSRHHRRKRVTVAALALMCLLILAGRWAASGPSSSLSASATNNSTWTQGDPSPNLALLAARTVVPAAVPNHRVVYPYSIVPGGVRTPQQLHEASQHDPLVRSHYADLDFRQARVIHLKQATWAYVSYRMGDRVFWTKRKVRLHKGERLITDGRVTARTRCANRVSEMPRAPVSAEEPPAEKLDEAVNVPLPPVEMESLLLPPGIPLGPPVLPPPPGGGGFPPIFPPPIPPPNPPPVPVPEPEAFLLIPLAASTIYLAYRKAAAGKHTAVGRAASGVLLERSNPTRCRGRSGHRVERPRP